MIKTQEDAVNAQKDKALKRAQLKRQLAKEKEFMLRYRDDTDICDQYQVKAAELERRIREI